METNLIYLLDSGNILNMFEIQKCWNKISQKDRYLYSKIHWLALDLLCTAVLGTIFFQLVFSLKLVSFSNFLGFKYAYLCQKIRLNLCRIFKDIYPSEEKLKILCHMQIDVVLETRWLIPYKCRCSLNSVKVNLSNFQESS